MYKTNTSDTNGTITDPLPFNKIPGPKFIDWNLLPGGKMYKKPLHDIYNYLREKHGNIVRIPAHLGRPDTIVLYEPDDFAKVFRTEGRCPTRFGMDSFEYYRKHVRPDVFKTAGLTVEQGERWCQFRKIADPVVASPLTVNNYISGIDEVTKEFLEITKTERDEYNETPSDFGKFIQRWALEVIGVIALDTRLGALDKNSKTKGDRLAYLVDELFRHLYEFDILPSIWRYVTTPGFTKYMNVLDEITNITMEYVDLVLERIETSPEKPESEQGVLEKLLKIDKHVAIVVSSDMLLSGIDTTSSFVKSLLYLLAKHIDKQTNLRQEIQQVLPDNSTPLNASTFKKLTYLKACMKEALRIYPVVIGTARCTGADIVVQGYQIPKGTHVVLSGVSAQNNPKYFKSSEEFLPERWIKSEEHPSEEKLHPFVYFPFGFGRRTCIGKRFAELEVMILFIRLIKNFEISWHHSDLSFNSSLVTTLQGKMKFRLIEVQQVD